MPKGPDLTKTTTAGQSTVNYYAIVFSPRPPDLLQPDASWKRKTASKTQQFQRKIKGQQLKGKIVSEFLTLFHTFFTIFQNFPPGLSSSKRRALAQGEQKREEKIIKRTGQIDVAR